VKTSQVCILFAPLKTQIDVEELFALPEKDEHLHGGVRRIHYETDLRQENSGIFTIWLEDHTVGHALRRILNKNPNVVFSGYRVCAYLWSYLFLRRSPTP
jgi:DNA-directed RNA polymerase II subunit RPB11